MATHPLFNDIRIISGNVTGYDLQMSHNIQFTDNDSNRVVMMPIRLTNTHVIVQSNDTRTSLLEIPLNLFNLEQISELHTIFNVNVDDDIINHLVTTAPYSFNNPVIDRRRTLGSTELINEALDMLNNIQTTGWTSTGFASELDPPRWTETPSQNGWDRIPEPEDTQWASPVKCVVSENLFRECCGVRKETPLTKFVFRKWGSKVMKDLGITEATCAICMCDVERWDKIAITKCKHVFHKNCAKTWFCKECIHPTCPTCRADIRGE